MAVTGPQGTHDSNARLVDLLRLGLERADEQDRVRVPLKLYSPSEQDELLGLLHAYLWDTATPHDDQWHRSPGNIMTLWAELLGIGKETRTRLISLRIDLVKTLTARGVAYRTHPRSVPLLVREYAGPVRIPVGPREIADTIAFGPWGAGYGDADKNRQVEMAAEAEITQQYEAGGWTIRRVAHLNCGWDLTASRGAEERHLEVQGVSQLAALDPPHPQRTPQGRAGRFMEPGRGHDSSQGPDAPGVRAGRGDRGRRRDRLPCEPQPMKPVRVVAVDVGSVKSNFALGRLGPTAPRPVGAGGRHPEGTALAGSRRSRTECLWCSDSRRL